jgi:hypothetical protein
MDKFLRDIILFSVTVSVVVGGFFWIMKGCNRSESDEKLFPVSGTQKALVGPLLALKNGNITLYPGKAFWQKIASNQVDDQDKLSELVMQLLKDKISESLDTVLLMEDIPQEEIEEFIEQDIRAQLQNLDLPMLINGKCRLGFNLTSFIISHRTFIEPRAYAWVDTLLFGNANSKLNLSRNY